MARIPGRPVEEAQMVVTRLLSCKQASVAEFRRQTLARDDRQAFTADALQTRTARRLEVALANSYRDDTANAVAA